MNMKTFFARVAILTLLCSPLLVQAAHEIYAQSVAPDYPTTACIQKLGEEVQGELQLRVAILQLQKQVQDLQDQLKAAKAKK